MRLKDETLLKSKAYVDGSWVDAAGGGTFAVTDPATGETLADVADLDGADAARAIDAADAAFEGWAETDPKERARLLRAWRDLIVENAEDLAMIMTSEQGKALIESFGEVHYGSWFVEWYAEEAKRAYGDIIPSPVSRTLMVAKRPVGVAAAITPWNFPNAMITRKCAPALAAGCPVVVKPAEATPLSALALAELAHRAGIPKGVFNVLPSSSGARVGDEFCANPKVKKLSFTGSTPVGKILIRQCADTVKKVSMELGGNAPFIVFEDADLDAAADGAIACKFRNSGQTCISANRMLVQRSVYDDFAERLAKGVSVLKVADGREEGALQGPLINEAAVEKVERHIADALDRGATALAGGKRHELGRTFFEPTVLRDVGPDFLIANEETFGPVAGLIAFDTEEEAIKLANDTPFGLAAYFYSRDVGRVMRVSRKLQYGMVGANTGVLSSEAIPFGGFKESGLGREGGYYGLEEYLETQLVTIAE